MTFPVKQLFAVWESDCIYVLDWHYRMKQVRQYSIIVAKDMSLVILYSPTL